MLGRRVLSNPQEQSTEAALLPAQVRNLSYQILAAWRDVIDKGGSHADYSRSCAKMKPELECLLHFFLSFIIGCNRMRGILPHRMILTT